jgi:hypothetical protein
VPGDRDHDPRLAAPARGLTLPRWALAGLLAYALIMTAAATVSQVINYNLISRQHAQHAQFCHAEQDIRAKITEIEVMIGTHVYVYLPPGC